MGLFDIFKKKKDEGPSYDPTNMKITDLKIGFFVDYDMTSWQVKGHSEYDWGNNNFSNEFKLSDGEKEVYLHIEQDAGLMLTVAKPIKIRVLDEDIVETIIEKKEPPKKLTYEGNKYFLDRESVGYYKDTEKEHDDWDELMSWDYYTEEGDLTLGVMQWGERDFEASSGRVVKEFEFSNIVPSE